MSLSHLTEVAREVGVTLPEIGNRSLLLVDDEQENLDVLCALLEDHWTVHTAQSGEAALALFDGGLEVDLVIADQRMAGMTGVELLTMIARRSPAVMRIILTAYSDVQPMVDAIERGAVYSFIVKPYDPEELRGLVTEALRVKGYTELLRQLVEILAERRDSLNRATQALRSTQEELLAAERVSALGQATAGIVHNLKNLSTIMNALVREIEHKTHDQALLQAANESHAGLSALIDLLENVQAFARLGDPSVQPAPTDIQSFLEKTVRLAMLQGNSAKCPLKVDTPGDLRAILIDSGCMSQAVLALLDNAVRASLPGSPVHISARKVLAPESEPPTLTRDEWACIEVADQGHGMDASTLDSAQRPFFSAFTPPGMGLGLETARLAALAHGGLLELNSEKGQGTRARLLFPLRGGA